MNKFKRSFNIALVIVTLKVPIIKLVEFMNSIDPDEANHHELPQLNLQFLPYID